MKLTPLTITAIDLVIQAIIKFQENLAPINLAYDAIVDAMMQLKETGSVKREMVDRINEAQVTLANFSKDIELLSIISPSCAILMREIELQESTERGQ